MPPRKERIAVVLDTNVIVGYYLSHSPRSANRKVFRLWRDQRKLQLIVNDDVVAEYLEVLSRLDIESLRIQRFAERLRRRETVTSVRLGPHFTTSRDPDDALLLAIAAVGKAQYLVTNDRDLLDLTPSQRRQFKFEIITPQQLLARRQVSTPRLHRFLSFILAMGCMRTYHVFWERDRLGRCFCRWDAYPQDTRN